MNIKRTIKGEVTLSLDDLKDKMKSHLGIKDPNMKVEPVIEYDEFEYDTFYVTGIKFSWEEQI